MAKTEFSLPRLVGITEHLLFVALLIPTFILLAAVAVSLTDGAAAGQQPLPTTVACEPCAWDNGEQGP